MRGPHQFVYEHPTVRCRICPDTGFRISLLQIAPSVGGLPLPPTPTHTPRCPWGGFAPPHPRLESAFGLHKCRPSADMDPGNQNVQDPRRIWDHSGAIWGPDGFLKNQQSKIDPKWIQNCQFGLKLGPNEAESTSGPFPNPPGPKNPYKSREKYQKHPK